MKNNIFSPVTILTVKWSVELVNGRSVSGNDNIAIANNHLLTDKDLEEVIKDFVEQDGIEVFKVKTVKTSTEKQAQLLTLSE